ncbi:OmpW family protein [Alcanivorax hongdengensis A-11-3]|uniref:OmpW family protein n=1 Tax=Alcanivorax hongdengensis A-11-3 TaxID=1177179 RepID=L0W9A0_9GAMM|nr:OmpW family outer membrane protein [Alcanivorax hongdengensis]EKF73559.1 OmpW family protein [Alcanivorax hongdengensis A-11-3]
MIKRYTLTGLAALTLLGSQSALAGKPPSYEDTKPDFFGTDTIRHLFGEDRLYFRLGALYVKPDIVTHSITLKNLSEIASVAVEPGPQEGEAYSDPQLQPFAIVGYKLPWGNDASWSLETIIGAPPTLKLKAKGKIADEPLVTEANGIPTGVPALGEEVAETKVIPPVVTLVKRFNMDSTIRPYVGLGVTYLYTYDTHVTNPILTEFGEPELNIDNKFGWVAQLGLDMHLGGGWWAAADFKYISVPDVTATLEKTYIRAPGLPQYQYAEVGDAEFKADLNNLAFGLGVGFTF